MMEVLTRAFYAQQDTRTPVLIGALAMGLNVALSFVFSAWFARIGWMPLGGLALANSFSTALEATALFIMMRKRLGGIQGGFLLRGFAWAAIGTLVMIAAVLVLTQLVLAAAPEWLLVGTGTLGGGIAYFLTMAGLRVPELQGLISAVQRRFLKPR